MSVAWSVTAPQATLEWGVASHAYAGQEQTGDAFVVVPRRDGVLLAAIDGLGHGVAAAEAGRTAASAVAEAADRPLTLVLQHAHETLRLTRGAAVALITIDTSADTLSWVSVGNIEAVLWAGDNQGGRRHRERIRQRSGLVGFRLPPLSPRTMPIQCGDQLVVGTDGVDPEFARARPAGSPEAVAERLLARFGKQSDDALVLAARYRGNDN